MEWIFEVKDTGVIRKIDEYNLSLNKIDFDEYDEQTFEEKNPGNYSIDIKIAINTGNALIGQIGSSNVSDFTVLGTTVDIIERIENICTEFGKQIIVTQNTLNQLDTPIPAEYLGQVRLKNSEEKVKIYELKLYQQDTD